MTTVEQVMSSPVVAIAPNDSLAQARNLMLRRKVSRLVVADGEKPVGIVTRKDLASRLVQAAPEWRRRPIDRIPVKLAMTPDPITIHLTATVEQAAVLMRDNDISGLLVVDKALRGVVTKTDLVRYYSRTKDDARVGNLMRPICTTVHVQHSLNHTIDTMDEHGVDRIIVVDGEKPVGIVTRDNLAFVTLPATGKRLKRPGRGRGRNQVLGKQALLVAEDVMTSPLVTTIPDEKATAAASVLAEEEFDDLPVVEDGELRGVFTMTDVVRYIAGGTR